MRNRERFSGIIPPLVTPLTENETADLPALHRLLDHCIKGGVTGVFVNGTSGEALRVSDQVWEQMTRETLRRAEGRIPVFCGAIDTSTSRTIQRIRRIEDMGGRLAVCTPPFYLTSFGQDEILRHFDKIANSVDIEIALYNIPETTHANILPETVARLADYENIVAYKDSTADWQQLQRALIRLQDKDIAVFNGAEELCSVSMMHGADGCIPGLANFMPELFCELRQSCLDGDLEKSRQLQQTIIAIRSCLFVNGCWVSAMKGLLELFHLGTAHISAPLLELSKAQKDEIMEILKGSGITPEQT